MNKLLVLLYFSLIISCSLSKECTEDDCEGQTVDGDKTHYACVPKDDDTCELKLLCEHAVKGEEETLKCSDFPAQHPSKICIKKDGEEACIEDFRCAKVSTVEEGKTCSSYKVSDNSKYLCGDDDTTEANACSKYVLSGATKVIHSCEAAEGVPLPCKETPFCSYVTSLETGNDCSNYPLEVENGDTVCIPKEGNDYICQEKYLCDRVPKGTTEACLNFVLQGEKKYTHYCTSNSESGEFACKSEQYSCNEVPKIEDGETTLDCSTFLDSTKSETHVCIEDKTSTTKQCKEMKLCSKVEAEDMAGVSDCSSSFYFDKEKYRCQQNKEGNKCEQVYLCEKAPTEETADCSTFATTDSEHVCLDDGTDKKCKEEFYCSKVPKSKESTDGFDCSTYSLSKENNDGEHICTKDLDSTTYACKEEYLCEKAKVGATDEECSKYPVQASNKDKNGCIHDKEKDQGCKEEQLCSEVANGDNVDCSKYPVVQSKIKTHICKAISNPTDKACEEVAKSEINCLEATKGESDSQCNEYKASAENKKCVKNSGEGDNPCMEKEKSECELKTTGATNDEACSSLAVEKTGEQACVKNPDGENCILLSFCKFGIPNSDGDCSQFALEDKEKKCQKKEGEDKCEEVEKKTEPEEPDEGETTEAAKTDKVKASDEAEKSDGTKTSDKEESSEAIKDASDTTAASVAKKENENSGNLINVVYSLLLINYLVLF